MQLQSAKENAVKKYTNADEIVAKLEAEYELLISKCNEYYNSKKRLMRIQQRQLKRTVDAIDMHTKCEELKIAFQEQRSRFNAMRTMSLQTA
jgi:stearoyl-CoA desaturase (delta-9 desaturase)